MLIQNHKIKFKYKYNGHKITNKSIIRVTGNCFCVVLREGPVTICTTRRHSEGSEEHSI